MDQNENGNGENSQENNGQQTISLETILSDTPVKPFESEYHTESVDQENLEYRGKKLED